MKHTWITTPGVSYAFCQLCGTVRQANGSTDNKPCPGVIVVRPR